METRVGVRDVVAALARAEGWSLTWSSKWAAHDRRVGLLFLVSDAFVKKMRRHMHASLEDREGVVRRDASGSIVVSEEYLSAMGGVPCVQTSRSGVPGRARNDLRAGGMRSWRELSVAVKRLLTASAMAVPHLLILLRSWREKAESADIDWSSVDPEKADPGDFRSTWVESAARNMHHALDCSQRLSVALLAWRGLMRFYKAVKTVGDSERPDWWLSEGVVTAAAKLSDPEAVSGGSIQRVEAELALTDERSEARQRKRPRLPDERERMLVPTDHLRDAHHVAVAASGGAVLEALPLSSGKPSVEIVRPGSESLIRAFEERVMRRAAGTGIVFMDETSFDLGALPHNVWGIRGVGSRLPAPKAQSLQVQMWAAMRAFGDGSGDRRRCPIYMMLMPPETRLLRRLLEDIEAAGVGTLGERIVALRAVDGWCSRVRRVSPASELMPPLSVLNGAGAASAGLGELSLVLWWRDRGRFVDALLSHNADIKARGGEEEEAPTVFEEIVEQIWEEGAGASLSRDLRRRARSVLAECEEVLGSRQKARESLVAWAAHDCLVRLEIARANEDLRTLFDANGADCGSCVVGYALSPDPGDSGTMLETSVGVHLSSVSSHLLSMALQRAVDAEDAVMPAHLRRSTIDDPWSRAISVVRYVLFARARALPPASEEKHPVRQAVGALFGLPPDDMDRARQSPAFIRTAVLALLSRLSMRLRTRNTRLDTHGSQLSVAAAVWGWVERSGYPAQAMIPQPERLDVWLSGATVKGMSAPEYYKIISSPAKGNGDSPGLEWTAKQKRVWLVGKKKSFHVFPVPPRDGWWPWTDRAPLTPESGRDGKLFKAGVPLVWPMRDSSGTWQFVYLDNTATKTSPALTDDFARLVR